MSVITGSSYLLNTAQICTIAAHLAQLAWLDYHALHRICALALASA